MVFKADRRLYLTKERDRVVEEGDPAAAFLLLPVDGEMPDAEAKKLGLDEHKQVRAAQETKSDADTAGNAQDDELAREAQRAEKAPPADNTLTSAKAGVRQAK